MAAFVLTLKALNNHNKKDLSQCHNLFRRCGLTPSFQLKADTRFLAKPEIREQTHSYIAGILRKHDCPTLLVGGVADHVHSLFALSKNNSIAEIVYEVKRGSSKWIKTQGSEFGKFHWQNGYGAFSISQSHVEQVRRYIGEQERRHRKVTFQDELREFLRRYQVDYDERYLWD